jgi:hypothetical protein
MYAITAWRTTAASHCGFVVGETWLWSTPTASHIIEQTHTRVNALPIPDLLQSRSRFLFYDNIIGFGAQEGTRTICRHTSKERNARSLSWRPKSGKITIALPRESLKIAH